MPVWLHHNFPSCTKASPGPAAASRRASAPAAPSEPTSLWWPKAATWGQQVRGQQNNMSHPLWIWENMNGDVAFFRASNNITVDATMIRNLKHCFWIIEKRYLHWGYEYALRYWIRRVGCVWRGEIVCHIAFHEYLKQILDLGDLADTTFDGENWIC